MKIAIITNSNPFFENTASANRWRSLIEGLVKNGAVIKLLITGGYFDKTEWKQLGRKGTYNSIQYEYLSFLFNDNIWLRRVNNYILKPLIKPIVFKRIIEYANKHKNSIFWTSSEYESFQLILKLKKSNTGLKTFLELNEFLDIHNINKGKLVHKIIGDKRQKLFEEKAFFAYDGIALMTTTLLNYYQNLSKQGPSLLHLPMTVDLDRFMGNSKPLESFKMPYIAFVGVMNNVKDGVDVLIEAFSLISSEFNKHNLYLVGPWHYDTPAHIKRIKEFGLSDRVFWMGEYKRDLIPSVIKNADLLVLPRPDSKQAQGGFPTKLGEYLATGKPVCVTKVGEISQYLSHGESAYIAVPGSPTSFADVMREALNNPERSMTIGQNGKDIAIKHFNKDIQSKILYNFFLEKFND